LVGVLLLGMGGIGIGYVPCTIDSDA
jgi:hypothetical protein